MIEATAAAKARWALAVVIASLIIVGACIVFRPPPMVVPFPSLAPSGVEIRKVTTEQSAFTEEAALRDLTPLFLPTERNASLRRLPSREPGQNFLEIEAPRFVIADSGWSFDRGLPPTATLNRQKVSAATPLDYLVDAQSDAPLTAMGRDERSMPVFPPRGGVVEVVRTRDGQRLFSEELRSEFRPPSDKLWQPLEFLASVGPAGLVAPMTISARSGVEEVDVHFRNYLAGVYRIGERLPPGIYRISVAP